MQKIFDASAVLAFLYNERGAGQVRADLPEGTISAVNAAEVLSVLKRNGMPLEAAREALAKTGLRIARFALEDAVQSTALLTAEARARDLSLGDRVCLALGITAGLPVVTVEHNWSGLSVLVADGSEQPLPVPIEPIR